MKIYLLDLDSLEYSTHSVKQFIELFNVEESLSNDTRVFTNLKKLKKVSKGLYMTTRNERLLEEIILFLDGHIKNYEDEKDINDMIIANMDFPYNSLKRKNIAEYSTKLKEKILLYYQGINEF